jgi:endonuclease YncB( thermonuclease family)
MAGYANYPLPHLLGQVNYHNSHRWRPDGDTIHLINPVLLVNGQAQAPKNGQLQVWVTGATKPRTIHLKGKPGDYYATVRFEGLDAPEEHYRATPFDLKLNGKTTSYGMNAAIPHDERSQPRWSPATQYAVGTLEKAGWALLELDHEVLDSHQRVLGYVYESNRTGKKKAFITLELLRQGFAYPFVFESAHDHIAEFLKAAVQARNKGLGVWKHYHAAPLPFADSFPSPKAYTTPEPASQSSQSLNLPVVFRRVVDCHQLKGLSMKTALRKYDVINYETGDMLPGDQYRKIPFDRLIWAPHTYK